MSPALSALPRCAGALAAIALAGACVGAARAQPVPIEDVWRAATQAARAGDFPRAIDLGSRLLQATEQRFGAGSLEAAQVLGLLGSFDRGAGRTEDAVASYEREIRILERLPDQGGTDYPQALSKLGMVHLSTDQPELAERPLRQALEWGRREMAADPDLAFLYNDVGLVLQATRRSAEAVPMFEAALRIRLEAPGMDPALLAISHDNLGNLYLSLQRYADAESELALALPLFRGSDGASGSDTLICLANLADLQVRTGRSLQAADLLSDAIDATTLAVGADRDGVLADLLRRRAAIRQGANQVAAAEADLDRALVIAEQHRHADTTERTLLSLGSLYEDVGDFARADAAYARAQSLQEARPHAPPELAHRVTLARARTAWKLGDLKLAGDLLQRLLDEDARRHGADSAEAAIALNNVASVQASAGDLDAARANVARAIAINTRLAPEGGDLAANLSLSGSLAERAGDDAHAESDYRSALALLAHLHGDTDARTDGARVNLELLLAAQGRTAEALQVDAVHAAAFKLGLRDVLALGDEQQGLAWVHARNPLSLLATLGAAQPLAQAALNYQGAVTDAVLAHRARTPQAASPEQSAALENWRRARRELTQLEIRRSTGDIDDEATERLAAMRAGTPALGDRDRAAAALATAQAEVLRLGASVSRATPSLDLAVADVQHALSAGTALVDFIRYSRYLGRSRFEDSFGALVLSPTAPVRWVPLGAAHDTERAIDLLQSMIVGTVTPDGLRAVLRDLHTRLVGPLLAAMPADTRQWLVAPDGALNRLSFATLLDDQGRFLAERLVITYVPSARAVLDRSPAAPNRRVAIYANPAFRLHGPRPAAAPSLAMPSRYRLPELEPLPATLREADGVRQAAVAHGWQAALRTGRQATEAVVRGDRNPGILHLATHGFYLPESGTELVESVPDSRDRGIGGFHAAPIRAAPAAASRPAPASSAPARRAATPVRPPEASITRVELLGARNVVLADPMLRSAVALAGAQDTLDAWRRGEVGPMDDDGVLNAEEAAALDLHSTWIVTLSSCDSGVGEAVPGEGILGLRRGFLQAGARNVLTTLWPVSDVVAADLMKAFYARAFATGDAPAALAEEQRRLLVALRARYGIDIAVRLGGAFVMTAQGLARIVP